MKTFLLLLVGLTLHTTFAAIVCPDKSTQCPNGSTCCLMTDGSYGCCPMPNATCCKDKEHCCPHGYLCNLAIGTCFRGDLTTPLTKHKPAEKVRYFM